MEQYKLKYFVAPLRQMSLFSKNLSSSRCIKVHIIGLFTSVIYNVIIHLQRLETVASFMSFLGYQINRFLKPEIQISPVYLC